MTTRRKIQSTISLPGAITKFDVSFSSGNYLSVNFLSIFLEFWYEYFLGYFSLLAFKMLKIIFQNKCRSVLSKLVNFINANALNKYHRSNRISIQNISYLVSMWKKAPLTFQLNSPSQLIWWRCLLI